ncbi:MAG TPA: hypothetical protein VFU16_09570 [Solirubrobacterales bacterium]|nr:hypothetical protein [Solirubrobacterales bacterium]
MRRSPFLFAASAVLAIVLAATAAWAGPTVYGPDGNTQSIDVQVRPKKLAKKTLTPGSLEVTTLTTSTTDPDGVPSPALHATIDFDRNLSLYTKGLPKCDTAKLQNQSTEVAEQVCGSAKIGSGSAIAYLRGGKVYEVPQTVTAFNGIPKGGKPTVILHTYGTAPLQVSLVLEGTVSNYGKEGYGPRLDLEIPKIAGGTGALKEFNVKIDRKWRFKGVKRSFISGKCPNSRKLKARGTFTYLDGVSLTATSKQSCQQRP